MTGFFPDTKMRGHLIRHLRTMFNFAPELDGLALSHLTLLIDDTLLNPAVIMNDFFVPWLGELAEEAINEFAKLSMDERKAAIERMWDNEPAEGSSLGLFLQLCNQVRLLMFNGGTRILADRSTHEQIKTMKQEVEEHSSHYRSVTSVMVHLYIGQYDSNDLDLILPLGLSHLTHLLCVAGTISLSEEKYVEAYGKRFEKILDLYASTHNEHMNLKAHSKKKDIK